MRAPGIPMRQPSPVSRQGGELSRGKTARSSGTCWAVAPRAGRWLGRLFGRTSNSRTTSGPSHDWLPQSGARMFESLGLTLRVFRELSGCSQAEIARKAQIGKSQLSKYENGKELPRLESLGKVIAVLGTTPLMVFYVSSVLDRANAWSGGLRADLLEQGAATFLHGRESRHYRELFDRFLALFESAAEARVLAARPNPIHEEEL